MSYRVGGEIGDQQFKLTISEKEFHDADFSTKLFGSIWVEKFGENLTASKIRQKIKENREYGREKDIHSFETHGFTNLDGREIYVSGNGAFDENGVIENSIVINQDRHQPNPEFLKLPKSIDEQNQFIKTALDLLLDDNGNARLLGLVTVGIATRSVLAHILPVKFLPFFIGETGRFKSSIALILLSFLKPGICNGYMSMDFNSSIKGIRLRLAHSNHGIELLDDYNTMRIEEDLVELLTLENSQVTTRFTASSATELSAPITMNTTPVVTGEVPLNTDKESRENRIIYFMFGPDITFLKELSQLQKYAEQGLFFRFMLLYIQWIMHNRDRVTEEIKHLYDLYRKKAVKVLPAGTHLRVCENTSDLFLGLRIFIMFCIERKILAEEKKKKYIHSCWQLVIEIISRQQHIIASYQPKGVITKSIKKALSENKLYLQAQNVTNVIPLNKGKKPTGDFLGYVRDESGDIYVPTTIDPCVILNFLPKRIQGLLSPSPKSFWKRLAELGVYIPMESGNKSRLKISGHSEPVACYRLHLPNLFD